MLVHSVALQASREGFDPLSVHVFDRAAYDLDRYHRRRATAITYLGGICIDCGAKEDLEFDHKDPATKSFNIGAIILHSDSKLYRELDKCVLRCGTHHRARTAKQQGVPHGGGLSGKKNCPCEPCKTRKAKYMREYHNQRRKRLLLK